MDRSGHSPDRRAGLSLVLTTFASSEDAERVVRQLLGERLIACGNIVPDVLSLYWWEGGIQREGEVLALLKTRADQVQRLFETLDRLHPYEVPEMIELAPGWVGTAYQQWVFDSTREQA